VGLLAVVSCLGLAATPARAEMDTLVKDALALTNKGQGQAALEMLSPKELERAGDPDFDLVLGIAANEAGEFSRAIFALERVLAVQPTNGRAKAELGRALFAVGDNKGARTMFEQSKTQGAPDEAAARIDQFIQAIDRAEAEGQSAWSAYAEATVGYDSNASAGSSSGTFAVPGLPTPLPVPNGKNSAMFSGLGLGFSGKHVIDPRWSLIASGRIGNTWHNAGAVGLDNSQANANVGLSYRVERNELNVFAQIDNYDSSSSNRNLWGLTGEWIYRFDASRQFSTYLQFASISYQPLGIYDVKRYVLGGTYAQILPNGWLGYAGAYLGKEDPDPGNAASVGHDVWGLRVGGQMPVQANLSAYGGLAYESRSYGGTNYPPFFTYPRDDKQASLSLGLVWTPVKTWRVTPSLTYVRNSSNISPFTYNRSVLSVTVRKQF
jgi:tetratricopeptide (TPR) repeat protein